MRRHLLVQEAVAIDAVDGIRAQLAGLDERFNRIDEIEAFILEIVGGCCGKHEQRWSGVPVRDERHFHVQVWAIPGSCATFHQGTFLKGSRAEDILADHSEAQVSSGVRAVDAPRPFCYKNA